MTSGKSSGDQRPEVKLSAQQTASVAHAVAEYIHAQRERYHPQAIQLEFGEVWARFFPAADLERLRVLQPGKERVPNPPFYEELGENGL